MKQEKILAYKLRVDEETGEIYKGYFEEIENTLRAKQDFVGGTIQFSIGKGGRAASDTVTVKLKAKTAGTANLKVEATGDIYDYDSLESVDLKGASTSVTVENQAVEPEKPDDGGNTPVEPLKDSER